LTISLSCQKKTLRITEATSKKALISRFPFIASEIFSAEINALMDKFFDAPAPKESAQEIDEEEVGFCANFCNRLKPPSELGKSRSLKKENWTKVSFPI